MSKFAVKDFQKPGLEKVPGLVTADDVYQTTTGSVHVNHRLGGVQDTLPLFYQPAYKKAPGSWKVNYSLNTIDKLNTKRWRRPLSMRHQCSEMKDRYRTRPEDIISGSGAHPNYCQHPSLSDHINEGPTQQLTPSTVNNQLKGRPFIPQNQAVLDRLEPYMTSNNWHYRTFSKEELNGYPKKDVATYWQCEDYPKAWGFGMKRNPLPHRLARTDPGPMRDSTFFRSGTLTPKQPSSMQPVTNGLKSNYSEAFTAIPPGKRKEIFYCPVKPTTHLQHTGSKVQDHCIEALQAVPHMYRTMNMLYGTGK